MCVCSKVRISKDTYTLEDKLSPKYIHTASQTTSIMQKNNRNIE